MNDELILNLLFSSTYVEMHAEAGKPPREVRIAHNYARRLLADRYGFEEFLKLDDRIAIARLLRRCPGLLAAAMFGVTGMFYRLMMQTGGILSAVRNPN